MARGAVDFHVLPEFRLTSVVSLTGIRVVASNGAGIFLDICRIVSPHDLGRRLGISRRNCHS